MERKTPAPHSRARWAAIGAAVAVSLGAGSIGILHAAGSGSPSSFVPITPCRLLDSRPGTDNVGNRNTPIGANTSHTVTAHGNNGNCVGIPTSATGLALNVTALNATSASFLTIWPTGDARPLTANLNPTPGEPPTPNAVTTGLSSSGQFDIYNLSGNVDVVVDVLGYYTGLNGADLADNSVSSAKTSNEPGVVYNYMGDPKSVNPTATSITATAIRVPTDGVVDVQVTGDWLGNDNATVDEATCQLQKGNATALDLTQPYFNLSEGINDVTSDYKTFSAHRIIPINVADNPILFTTGQNLRLTCVEQAGDVSIDNLQISATFFATGYAPQGLIFFPFP